MNKINYMIVAAAVLLMLSQARRHRRAAERPAEPTSVVEAGQVWTYEYKKGSPWDSHTATQTVLEVKNGWVRYEETGRGDYKYETSAPVSIFVFGAERVK